MQPWLQVFAVRILVLDALTTTLAATPSSAGDVLETLRLYATELGLPVSMGLSNVVPRLAAPRPDECPVLRHGGGAGNEHTDLSESA